MAETQSSTTPPAAGGKKKVTVRFTGSSVTIRRITAKDFEKAGAKGMDDQEWAYGRNKHEVDATNWPKEAVDLVRKQPNFQVEEA